MYAVVASVNAEVIDNDSERVRARQIGIEVGVLETGYRNAITDVAGVEVGHTTLIKDDDVRTGVTVIIPHQGNVYQDKVPGGIAIGNGFGKLAGFTQVAELGEIETPIALTNTLAVSQVVSAIVDWTLQQPGNERVVSVNAVVGETNDSRLNNIRKRVIREEHVAKAIASATSARVVEGAIGAGAGTVCFGWKGGIGTSSRVLPASLGGYTVGVLVQSNFGGVLQVDGLPVGETLGGYYLEQQRENSDPDGSIMIVVATDAPLSDRNLTRLAKRALLGLARTGATMSNGSGDYVISFSTAESVRRTAHRRTSLATQVELPNNHLSSLSQATIEATEEAIYNSLLMASTIEGFNSKTGQAEVVKAIPISAIKQLIRSHNYGNLAQEIPARTTSLPHR